MPNPLIIAVDFDGTLCEDKYPNIGPPNYRLIHWLFEARCDGAKLILYTCRHKWFLQQAVDWCRDRGLTFDAVNENLPERIALFDGDTRKISADIYIDDKAIHPLDDGLDDLLKG